MRRKNYFKIGYHFQQKGQYKKAVQAYNKISKQEISFILSRISIAYCLIYMNKHTDALDECRNILFDNSIKELEQSAWLSYTDENPYIIASYACVKLGRLQEATELLLLFSTNHSEGAARYNSMIDTDDNIWVEICASGAKIPSTFRLVALSHQNKRADISSKIRLKVADLSKSTDRVKISSNSEDGIKHLRNLSDMKKTIY